MDNDENMLQVAEEIIFHLPSKIQTKYYLLKTIVMKKCKDKPVKEEINKKVLVKQELKESLMEYNNQYQQQDQQKCNQITALQNTCKDLEKQLLVLKTFSEQLTNEKQRTKTQLQQQNTQINDLKQDNINLKKQIESQQEKLFNLNQQCQQPLQASQSLLLEQVQKDVAKQDIQNKFQLNDMEIFTSKQDIEQKSQYTQTDIDVVQLNHLQIQNGKLQQQIQQYQEQEQQNCISIQQLRDNYAQLQKQHQQPQQVDKSASAFKQQCLINDQMQTSTIACFQKQVQTDDNNEEQMLSQLITIINNNQNLLNSDQFKQQQLKQIDIIGLAKILTKQQHELKKVVQGRNELQEKSQEQQQLIIETKDYIQNLLLQIDKFQQLHEINNQQEMTISQLQNELVNLQQKNQETTLLFTKCQEAFYQSVQQLKLQSDNYIGRLQEQMARLHDQLKRLQKLDSFEDEVKSVFESILSM